MKLNKNLIIFSAAAAALLSLVIWNLAEFLSPDKLLSPETTVFINFVRFILVLLAIILYAAKNRISEIDFPEPGIRLKDMFLPVAAIIVLISLHFLTAQTDMHYLFNLDEEWNIPTFFSSLLLGLSTYYSLRLLLRKKKLFFGLLFLITFAMALDELVMIHENLSRTLGTYDNIFLYPIAFLIITAMLLAGRAVKDKGFLAGIVMGFFIIFLGAVVFDSLGHRFPPISYGMMVLEEASEMLGASVILLTLLKKNQRM